MRTPLALLRKIAHDRVSLGIQNLFNRDCYPLYSQLMRSSTNTSHLPAPGACGSAPANRS